MLGEALCFGINNKSYHCELMSTIINIHVYNNMVVGTIAC